MMITGSYLNRPDNDDDAIYLFDHSEIIILYYTYWLPQTFPPKTRLLLPRTLLEQTLPSGVFIPFHEANIVLIANHPRTRTNAPPTMLRLC